MIKVLFFSVIFMSSTVYSQMGLDSGSVMFESSLTWEEVIKKAKDESKYIFVDCFATWCAPCKKMDTDVYTDDKVATIANKYFVSLKLQMDSTNNDDYRIKKWYAISEQFRNYYSVSSYPTYLFFAPDGKVVHKAVGFFEPSAFERVLNEVFDPNKQYYSVLRNFRPGMLDTSQMKGLARAFMSSDSKLAGSIAADYLTRIPKREVGTLDNIRLIAEFQDNAEVMKVAYGYINGLSTRSMQNMDNIQLLIWLSSHQDIKRIVEQYVSNLSRREMRRSENISLVRNFRDIPSVRLRIMKHITRLTLDRKFTRPNIRLIKEFTTVSDNDNFSFFYNHANKIDSIMQMKGYSQAIVDMVIAKEEIEPALTLCKDLKCDPNWIELSRKIEEKYSKVYSRRIVLFSKVDWYRTIPNWTEFTKYAIELIDEYKCDTTDWNNDLFINNIAWNNIFLRSGDDNQIKWGIKRMEGVVRRDLGKHPTFLDTYANLLYKAGRFKDAIHVQRRACELDPRDLDIKANFDKMQAGIPTWPPPIEK